MNRGPLQHGHPTRTRGRVESVLGRGAGGRERQERRRVRAPPSPQRVAAEGQPARRSRGSTPSLVEEAAAWAARDSFTRDGCAAGQRCGFWPRRVMFARASTITRRRALQCSLPVKRELLLLGPALGRSPSHSPASAWLSDRRTGEPPPVSHPFRIRTWVRGPTKKYTNLCVQDGHVLHARGGGYRPPVARTPSPRSTQTQVDGGVGQEPQYSWGTG